MATSPWYYIASCVSLLGRVSAWVSDDLLALWVCKGTRWGTGGDRNSSCPWTSKDRTQGDYVTELICMMFELPESSHSCHDLIWVWGFSSQPSKPPFTYSHTMDGQQHVVRVYLHVHIYLCLMQLNKTGSAAPNWRTQIIPPKFTTTIIHAHLILQSQKNFLHPRDVKYIKL